MSTAATGLVPFTFRLTRARFASRSGESLLYGASVLASSVCSAIAFTVAGGTWMFYRRWKAPTGLHAELAADPTFLSILAFYVALAGFACALIVPSLVSLAAAGAQLGARGRERRLAALRLLGLSSGDVTRMALLDAVVQTVIGTLIGFVVYVVTLPFWASLSFEAVGIAVSEMWLPWWLATLVGVTLVALSMVAAAWGLRQVRISPLGVSRRANSPAARAWRLVLFVVVVVSAMATTLMLDVSSASVSVAVTAGMVLLFLAAMNVVGPFVLQTLARPLVFLPAPALVTAARRVIAAPGATWMRVSTLGVLAFIGGYLATMPLAYEDDPVAQDPQDAFMRMAQNDFTQGAIITLAFGFALTATSLLITQASATIERAEQSRALYRVGVPDGFALRVMWLETFGPLLINTAIGTSFGVLLSTAMTMEARSAGIHSGSGVVPMTSALAGGLLIAAAALWASHPLQRRILGTTHRRND